MQRATANYRRIGASLADRPPPGAMGIQIKKFPPPARAIMTADVGQVDEPITGTSQFAAPATGCGSSHGDPAIQRAGQRRSDRTDQQRSSSQRCIARNAGAPAAAEHERHAACCREAGRRSRVVEECSRVPGDSYEQLRRIGDRNRPGAGAAGRPGRARRHHDRGRSKRFAASLLAPHEPQSQPRRGR